jgi:hypothetical protein
MMIGVDGNTHLVFEGQGQYGYGIWPTPVLSMATLMDAEFDVGRIPVGTDLLKAQLVFREDSFDPVTRIRRGRLYKTPGTQPQMWRVHLHANIQGSGQSVNMPLHGFDSNQLSGERHKFRNSLIALGGADAYTLWRVVSVERIVSGEDLLTLRARSSLGTLPELDESKLPEGQLAKVKETLEKLSEAVYRAGPESVIDRARDFAQWSIGTWLAERRDDAALRTLDLWELAGKLEEKDYAVIRNTGRSIARLHARVKPNVQEEKQTRPITEDDAEFALAASGLLIREFGWAV